MIKALILDADGVIILGKTFSERLTRDHNVDPDKEREFFTTLFQDCILGKADVKEVVAPYLTSFGFTGTADALMDYWITKEYKLNQPLIDYIKRVRATGLRVVMASNQEKYRAQYIKEQMGLGNIFDNLFISCDIGLKKPTAEFLDYVLNDLGITKDQAVFWDDEQKAADQVQAYGMPVESYTNFDAFVSTMAEKYQVTV